MENNSILQDIIVMRYDKNGKRIRPDGNGTGKSNDEVTSNYNDGFKTFKDSFGTVDLTDKEEKEIHFGEICRTEDARVSEAQRSFHARMSQKEKDDAVHWIAHYRYIVGDADKE